MITVHHLNNSRSQRVLWLLEELDIPYEVKQYQRNPATMRAPPELQAVHPLGKSPVISDRDITVAETGAIIEYLLDTYGQGRLRPPAGSRSGRRFTYWLHFAEGSLMPPLLMRLVFDRLAAAPMPFFVRPVANGVTRKVRASFIDPEIERLFAFVESELGKSEWFAGEAFSAADIQMSFPIEVAALRAGLGPERPRLRAFLERIRVRPAYQRALTRGGPYLYARQQG
jgi:glutathione S-transferase